MTYTIQQTAKLSGLPESTLRYYESVGIIPHIKRDPSSKHRVYNENDMEIVVTVACLAATGMSIDDMKSYLKSAAKEGNSAKIQIELLKAQAKHLAEEETYLHVRQKYVKVKIKYWKAVEEGNKKKVEQVRKQAIKLAKELKKLKEVIK